MSNTSNVDVDAQHTHTDILIPVLADGTPIIWDGNDAHIEGTLHDVGKYYLRVGLFQPLFRHRAVALSKGRLAMDHPASLASARSAGQRRPQTHALLGYWLVLQYETRTVQL